MAKTAANLAAKFVCDEAIQLLGGYGFSREYPVERGLPRHPWAVHRRGHGRDPAQLRRHERVARRDAGQRRLEAQPRLTTCSHATFEPAARPSTDGRAARGTDRRSTHCSPRPRARRAPSRGRGRRRWAARGRRRSGRRRGVAGAQPRPRSCSPTARAGASARSPRRSITRPDTEEVDPPLEAVQPRVVVDLDALPSGPR